MTEINAARIAAWPTLAMQDGPVQGVLGADGAQPGAGPNAAPGAAQQPGGLGWFLPIMMMMVAFLFISTMMGGRKEKKRRAEMLAGLKKRDRVQTAGGVIGTIVEIKGDECLLESDRSSNTRLWVARSAVSGVLRAGPEGADQPTDKTQEAASA